MQKTSDLVKALSPLNLAFAREFNAKQLEFYAEMLKDIPAKLIEGATLYLVKNSKFLPSIAEIRSTAEGLYQAVEGKEEHDHAEAWEQVMNAARSWGFDNGLDHMDETVRKVAKRIGWRDICYCNEKDLPVIRAQFRDAYNSEIAKSKEGRRKQAVINATPALKARQNEVKSLIENTVKQIGE